MKEKKYFKSRMDVVGKPLSEKQKEEIDKAVKKMVDEYGEVLKLLGRK